MLSRLQSRFNLRSAGLGLHLCSGLSGPDRYRATITDRCKGTITALLIHARVTGTLYKCVLYCIVLSRALWLALSLFVSLSSWLSVCQSVTVYLSVYLSLRVFLSMNLVLAVCL